MKHTSQYQVPAHAGVTGFLRLMQEILSSSGVEDLSVSKLGSITVNWDVPDEDELNRLSDLIRKDDEKNIISTLARIKLEDITGPTTPMTPAIALLEHADAAGLYPCTFLAQSEYSARRRLLLQHNVKFHRTLFGVPVVTLPTVAEDRLVLLAASSPRVDTYLATHGFSVAFQELP